MKARYKLLLVILFLWLGMSYEGARNLPQPTPRVVNNQHMTLEEQIKAYEAGLIDGIVYDGNRHSSPHDLGASYQGNLIARLGRNIGDALQTLVREGLRRLIRFFDGVIS